MPASARRAKHPAATQATSPPILLQNLLLTPLSVPAKVFRVRPYYQRWDSHEPS